MSENVNDSPEKNKTQGHTGLKHSPSQNSLGQESTCNSTAASAQTSPTSSPVGDATSQGGTITRPSPISTTSSGDVDGTAFKVSNRQSKIFTSDPSPAVIAQTNWTFVETMLSVSASVVIVMWYA